MKSISRWAAKHTLQSRIIIVLGHVLLVLLAISFGLETSMIDIKISSWMTKGLGNLFFISYILYPWFKTDHGFFKYSYRRQKAHDFILVLSYFLSIVCGLNQLIAAVPSESEYMVEARFIVYHHNPGKDASKGTALDYKTKIKAFKKQLRVELLRLKRTLKAKNDKGGVVIIKILLVLLSVVLALGLMYVIAALSCSVACSGSEGIAWVIIIVGWSAAIWLLIVALKAILRKRQNLDHAAIT
ncbi:MAG: hypothetical protein ABIR66_05885 [Saprospiraceae bacterium]